jgi:hypothetical protein
MWLIATPACRRHGHPASSAGFFDVFGIRLREGRLFDERDRADSVPVAVISARLAETAWPGQSAIGKHLRLSPREDSAESLEVVGVVADSVQANYFEESARLAAHRGDGNVFRPASQTAPAFFSVAVRADGKAAALGQSIREAVLAIDADQPVYWLRSMNEWRERMLWSSDLLASMFSVFAGFALLLAVAGIYAVLAFDVARRTREIGVRRAMGADSRAILGMILARAGRQGDRRTAGRTAAGLVVLACSGGTHAERRRLRSLGLHRRGGRVAAGRTGCRTPADATGLARRSYGRVAR